MKTAIRYFALALLASLVLLSGCKKKVVAQGPHLWTSSEAAAPGSVEAQLRSEGKHWIKTDEPIVVGCYVQDTLEGRFGQPKGRGAIGKVTDVSPPGTAVPAATVDFGRGYSPGINLSELSRVKLDPE